MSHITSYSGRAIGTVIDYPEDPDAMRLCYGRTVRLDKEIASGRPITSLNDARAVANNMAPSGKSMVILKEVDEYGSASFRIYMLDGEIRTDYSTAGITFSNMQRAGQDLPKNVSLVEVYDKNKTTFELSVLDTETPHPYPVEDEHFYCGAPSGGSYATRAAGSFSEWILRGNDIPIGRRLHYVYHTSPVTADFSGRVRDLGQSSPEKVIDRGVLSWFLDEAKKDPSKILNLEYQTLALAGKETRAELIKGLLYAKDLSDEEKAVGCLGLFKTIPQDETSGRNAKKEAAWIFENLRSEKLMGKLLTTTPTNLVPLLIATLDALEAPDGLFEGTYSKSDVALSGGEGVLEGTVGFLNGTAELVTHPVPLVTGLIDLTQTAADRLAIAWIGADNLPEDVSQRLYRTDAAIGAGLKYYDDLLKAANRLGAGPLIEANMAGKLAPDAAFLLLCLAGPVIKASKYAKDIGALSKAELTGAVSAELAGYSPRARKFILMLAGL